MKEDFLYFVWQHKHFISSDLRTVSGKLVDIINLGQKNVNSGPDFFNSQLIIGQQKWAGNVEIHVKSSDWYLHNHEKDTAYNNVILHVVWEHDVEVFRSDNSVVPTLELKNYIEPDIQNKYNRLLESKSWINCENDFASVDDFAIKNWIERLYIERLERKSTTINQLLVDSKNNWEAVLFVKLCKNFGLKVNADSFFSIAKSVDFSILRKVSHNALDLEALLFGQANLLKELSDDDTYSRALKENYQFLKQKFNLNTIGVTPVQFFRLRPANFPTIRLSQLAMLYSKDVNLFSKLMEAETLNALYAILTIQTSTYWDTHYTFSKLTKKRLKKTSKSFIDLLIINTVLPLKFAYFKANGKSNSEQIFKLIQSIKVEKNGIVNKFLNLKKLEKTAMTSQGLIQLKTEYCDKNKCLQCAIGNALISKNT